uniref:Uncharacterized protein n=1 Tax=Oryza punctata TaxID=4537 RepID=A0A0E0MH53_ORYPU
MSATTRDDEACPSTTTTTATDESAAPATTPAVTTSTIHDDDGGGAAPAPPSPKRRKVAAAATPAPAVVDERARLKRRIAWVADKIATHRDEVETPYGFADDCYGYAGYGFVGWVRADFAGEERVAERAAMEAWMQIEWERRLLRWRRGEQQLGIDGADDSSFGVWDDDDDHQEVDSAKKTESKLIAG